MPIIHFDTVSKIFSEDSYGLLEVTFVVEPGELLFITGPSGSGKTTLMRLLTREYTPSSGEIFFKDTPLSEVKAGNVHEHRRKIGVVFQDYQLVPEMNVWENIALPLYVSGKNEHEVEQRVTDLLNLIKLPEKADQFPSQLSGGEAQRVSIARALAVGPELIFADEPTGNLDAETSKSIARLLRKINELGTTILIATHDQEVMNEHTDVRHIKLEKGKLIFDSKKKNKSNSALPQTVPTKKTVKPKVTDSEDEQSIAVIEKPEPEELPIKNEKKSFWGSFFKRNAKPNPDEKAVVPSEPMESHDITDTLDTEKSEKKALTDSKENKSPTPSKVASHRKNKEK